MRPTWNGGFNTVPDRKPCGRPRKNTQAVGVTLQGKLKGAQTTEVSLEEEKPPEAEPEHESEGASKDCEQSIKNPEEEIPLSTSPKVLRKTGAVSRSRTLRNPLEKIPAYGNSCVKKYPGRDLDTTTIKTTKNMLPNIFALCWPRSKVAASIRLPHWPVLRTRTRT